MKGAPVDLSTGELVGERFRIPTPRPAVPDTLDDVVARIAAHHGWNGPIGVTFPGVVRNGIIGTAVNLDPSWVGLDAATAFARKVGAPVLVLNDADAAALAEHAFGAARGRSGVIMVLTFGTGIGSGVLVDGRLVPNTELGHLELDGYDAEQRAAASARKRHDWSWKKWARHVQRYLEHLERIFSPDLFVIGGGISKKPEKWIDFIDIETELVPAELANNAGIVGAALATDRLLRQQGGGPGGLGGPAAPNSISRR